jgi:hypothetical protein
MMISREVKFACPADASGQNRGEIRWPPVGRSDGYQQGDSVAAYGGLSMAAVRVVPPADEAGDEVVVDVPWRYLPSSAQTADAWTERSCASRAPVGAAMLSDIVTDRRPLAVAAAHCT